VAPATRAILVVDQVGLPADHSAFARLAARTGVAVIEDAACAIGSRVAGRPVGADAEGAGFSLHPRQLLTTGEGGMIVTRDGVLDARIRSLRHHGVSVSDYQRHTSGGVVAESYGEVGFNFRMTDLQAAIGLVQLARIPEFVARRIAQGERYSRAFAKDPGLHVPVVAPDVTFNYQTYMLRLGEGCRIDRDGLMRTLLERGIATRRGVMAAHLEPAYRDAVRRVPLPATEEAARNTIVLPLFHDLTLGQQDDVIGAVLDLV